MYNHICKLKVPEEPFEHQGDVTICPECGKRWVLEWIEIYYKETEEEDCYFDFRLAEDDE